jgi:hypothetical protein
MFDRGLSGSRQFASSTPSIISPANYETVRMVLPLMLPELAVIVVLPAATVVATPELLMVAMVALLEVQVTELVMVLVDPSV